jgi:hypothetical protein
MDLIVEFGGAHPRLMIDMVSRREFILFMRIPRQSDR